MCFKIKTLNSDPSKVGCKQFKPDDPGFKEVANKVTPLNRIRDYKTQSMQLVNFNVAFISKGKWIK